MEKLPMCRICLAENIRMCVVVNKNLHELYEKLTDIPFVTEDSRPISACFICYAKLRQWHRFMTKCLEAEELYTKMMTGNYERNNLVNQDHFKFFGGLVRTPIESINIFDTGLTKSIDVKEEIPTVGSRLDDIIKPKEEHQSDDLKVLDIGFSDEEDILLKPHHFEKYSDDVPLIAVKTEMKKEKIVFDQKRRRVETNNLKVLDIGFSDEEDILLKPHHFEKYSNDVPLIAVKTEMEIEKVVFDQERSRVETNNLKIMDIAFSNEEDILLKPHHFEKYSEDDVPLIAVKTEMEKEKAVFDQKRRWVETNRPTVEEEPKLHLRRTKLEDSIPADQKTNQVTDSTVIQNTRNHTSKSVTKLKKPHECDICHCKFIKKGDLTKHVRMHTSVKPYSCHICPSVFSVKRYLTKHIRTHIGEKPYNCDVCQRSFSQRAHLTGHIRTHTGEKPYKCDVCQFSFRSKSNLKKHIQTHTGEKPFKCDICQACFGSKSDLTKHIRIHTGEKPFMCVVCQRGFSQKVHLTVHIRTHTGEKPYKCNLCQRCFRDSSDLKKHTRIHTAEKRYHCEKCQRGFNEKNNLLKHCCRFRE